MVCQNTTYRSIKSCSKSYITASPYLTFLPSLLPLFLPTFLPFFLACYIPSFLPPSLSQFLFIFLPSSLSISFYLSVYKVFWFKISHINYFNITFPSQPSPCLFPLRFPFPFPFPFSFLFFFTVQYLLSGIWKCLLVKMKIDSLLFQIMVPYDQVSVVLFKR